MSPFSSIAPQIPDFLRPRQCVDAHDYVWGKWYHEKNILKLTYNTEELLERLILTALLNVWFFQKEAW